MISKPPASQIKKWHEYLVQAGCAVTGSPQVQIHHPKGRKFKTGGVECGEVFCYAIWADLHDISSNNPLNVSYHKNAFQEAYGREIDIFLRVVEEAGASFPFDQVYLDALNELAGSDGIRY